VAPRPAEPPAQLSLEMMADASAAIPVSLWTVCSLQERMFIASLLADPRMNQTAAAKACGSPATRAKKTGSEIALRPHVKAAIDAAIATRISRIEVKQDRVLREVDTVSLSNIEHYRLTDDGNVELAEGAPPDAMRAISGLKRKTRVIPQKNGEPIVEYDVEFKLWDKPGTLRLSMQHRGMLIERHEVKLPPGSGVLAVPVPPGDDQWAAGAAAQQAALAAIPPTAAAPSES